MRSAPPEHLVDWNYLRHVLYECDYRLPRTLKLWRNLRFMILAGWHTVLNILCAPPDAKPIESSGLVQLPAGSMGILQNFVY